MNFVKQFHGATAFTYKAYKQTSKNTKTNLSRFKRKCDELEHSQTNLTSVIKGEN
jgi:hypothetical protein